MASLDARRAGRGCCWSVRQAAKTLRHGQRTSKQREIRLRCWAALKRMSQRAVRCASLRSERERVFCTSTRVPAPIACARHWKPLQCTSFLLFCALISLFLPGRFPVQGVRGDSAVAAHVQQGITFKTSTQDVTLCANSRVGEDSGAPGLVETGQQCVRGQTAVRGDQLKRKDWDAGSAAAHETAPATQSGINDRAMHSFSPSGARAEPLPESSSAERIAPRMQISASGEVDNLVLCSEVKAQRFVQAEPPVPEGGDATVGAPLVGSKPVNADAAAPAAAADNARERVKKESSAESILPSSTPLAGGQMARALDLASQPPVRGSAVAGKLLLTPNRPVEPHQPIGNRLMSSMNAVYPYSKATKSSSISDAEELTAQSAKRFASAAADMLLMSVSNEMVPLAAAILEAANAAAPELLDRVQSASKKASRSTSLEDRAHEDGNVSDKEEADTLALLRDTVAQALRAALLKEEAGFMCPLLSSLAPALHLPLPPIGSVCAREYGDVTASKSIGGPALPEGPDESDTGAPALSSVASIGTGMTATSCNKAEDVRSCQPSAPDSPIMTERIFRSTDERPHNRNGCDASRCPSHGRHHASRRRRLLRILLNLLPQRRQGDVTQEPKSPGAGKRTRRAFSSLKGSPSDYYRGMYPAEKEQDERWVYEFQPPYKGGDVVKVRSSYSKARAAFKVLCDGHGHPRGKPRACAALYDAQRSMKPAGKEPSPADKMDDVMQNIIIGSWLKKRRSESTPGSPAHRRAAAGESAPEDPLSLLASKHREELRELLATLGAGADGEMSGQHFLPGEEQSALLTASSGPPADAARPAQHRASERALGAQAGRDRRRPALVSWALRSTDIMDTVTEVIDMTELGEVASFNTESFLRQQTCGNLYSTLLLDSEHPGPNVECVLRSLAAHAVKVAKGSAIRTSSILVKMFTRIFCIFKKDEIALDLLRSAQLAIADSTRKVYSTRSKSVANAGNLLNEALKARPEGIPFFVTLFTSREFPTMRAHRQAHLLQNSQTAPSRPPAGRFDGSKTQQIYCVVSVQRHNLVYMRRYVRMPGTRGIRVSVPQCRPATFP